jgi:hypothetical protein
MNIASSNSQADFTETVATTLVVLALFLLLLLPACSLPSSTRIRAAYLVHSPGQLFRSELAGHPEIFVTSSFAAFQRAARQRIGLWVDSNALDRVDSSWFDQMPQAAYPIIVVGYGDSLHSFRDGLGICCYAGPATLYPGYDDPGYSVIMRTSGEMGAATIFAQDFKQPAHVEDILRINNELLDGNIPPTPTYIPPQLPSPTMP